MNSENLKVNELKILTHLLTRLEKRIYLLRISLYGSTDKYCVSKLYLMAFFKISMLFFVTAGNSSFF